MNVMKRYGIILSLLVLLSVLSCTDENTISTPQFEIVPVNEAAEFVIGPEATSLTDGTGLKVFIYSNQSWSVSMDFEEGTDTDWVSVYPDHGDGDGRFFINVSKLDEAYPRTCTLNVNNYDTGELLYSTVFRQNGVDAFLDVSENLLSYSHEADTKSVNVNTNVNWLVNVLPKIEGEDVSWCRALVDSNTKSCRVSCEANETDVKRYAVLKFYMVEDETLYKEVELVQLPEYKVTNAELKTIAEVMAMDDGLVEENIKVQGYVISDKTALNMPDNDTDMYIQDESGKGMIVHLTSADDYSYGLDEKLSVWMIGTILDTDSDGVRRLVSVSTSNIFAETTLEGNAATPVEINDVTSIDDYRNTLVRIKGAYFATPYGTICNVGTWKGNSCEYGLTNILDSYGNKLTMRTMTSFPEKWDMLLTDEEYDIVGIVTADKGEWMWVDGVPASARLRGENYNNTLRVRRISDISLSNSGKSVYRRITYWQGISTSKSNWKPAFGEGVFDLKSGIKDGTQGSMSDAEKSRLSYCLRYDDREYEDASCWKGYSTKSYWDSEYGGYYYECSTSTSDVTGDLYLTFVMGNYGVAGRYWKVQYSYDSEVWTDVPDGKFELWNMMSTTANTDLSRLYASQSFVFKIPGAAGHENVSVRITTQGQENKCSDGRNRAVGNTSSTCLFYFGFVERK